MVVAGTDAAAVVLPHLARQLTSLHSQRADVATQVETLVEAHPLYQVLTSMPGIGVPAAAVLAGRDPGQDLQHRRPAGLLRRARSRHTPLRLIDPWRGASPTAATRGSSAPCSCPPSPPCAPTPSPGPTTSANETKANRLGPGRSRPGPPPHPDPARHDPRWSPLRPTTSHETTRRRLTHHIGAPPRKPIGWGTDKAGRRKRLYDAPRTPLDRLLDTSALTKAQKTDLVSYRNQLNPASITRRIIELQDVLIRLAKDKTDQLYLAQIPSILPDVHKGVRVRKAS